MLQAAFWQGKGAVDPLEEWLGAVDADAIGESTAALLPLLFAPARDRFPQHARTPWLKGVYRHAWVVNQQRLAELAPTVSRLHEAGIEIIPIGDAGFAVQELDRDRTIRFARPQLLVRHEKASHALDILEGVGWRPSHGSPRASIGIQSGTTMFDEWGELELRWRLLHPSCDQAVDDAVWVASTPAHIGGTSIRSLSRTDSLLYACVRGGRVQEVASPLWIAAALAAIASGEIDWQRLAYLAQRGEVSLLAREALRYLQRTFDARIDPSAMARMDAMDASRLERADYLLATAPSRPMQLARFRWESYRALRSCLGFGTGLSGLAEYLAAVWQLPGRGQVPLHAARLVLATLRSSRR